MENKPKALGRGLSALFPNKPAQPVVAAQPPISEGNPTHIAIERIERNPMQPRYYFNNDELRDLADSIQAHGIIQPLVVRKQGANFQLVAGERRLKAAKILGLSEVPVWIQEVADNERLEIALIENIQREDLNPIEAARAFDRLGRDLNLSQEEVGRRTGKDRVTIANLIRLLRLPREVQMMVEEGRLGPSHARAILGLATEDQVEMAKRAAQEGLSVRQVEERVQRMTQSEKPSSGAKTKSQDPNVRAAVEELGLRLGTRVRIVEINEKRGRIEIEYYSPEELDRLYELIVSGIRK